jgi:hypothetical protein
MHHKKFHLWKCLNEIKPHSFDGTCFQLIFMPLNRKKKKNTSLVECQLQNYDKYVVKVSSDPLIRLYINQTNISLFTASNRRGVDSDIGYSWTNYSKMAKRKLGELESPAVLCCVITANAIMSQVVEC